MTGRCGPCCSVEPTGTMTMASRAAMALSWGAVRLENSSACFGGCGGACMGGAISGIVAGGELYLPLHPRHRPNRPPLPVAGAHAVDSRRGDNAALPSRRPPAPAAEGGGGGLPDGEHRRQHGLWGLRGRRRGLRLLPRRGARFSPVLRDDPPARLRRARYAAADPDRGAALMFRSFGFDEFVL